MNSSFKCQNVRPAPCFIFIFLFFFTTHCCQAADISFMIADLKYNKEQGVKICEVQLARGSTFYGSRYNNNGSNAYVIDRFFEVLASYQTRGWITRRGISEDIFSKQLKERGWIVKENRSELIYDPFFSKVGRIPPKNRNSLLDYQGIAYLRFDSTESCELLQRKYPGIIFLDAAAFKYRNKSKMSQLFEQHEILHTFKPKWKQYPKEYKATLAQSIIHDIGSEIFVIKPLNQCLGRGVIIVDREHLDETLQLILNQKRQVRRHEDKVYCYWTKDKNASFIVEAFIPSDPVFPPQYGDLPFDGTHRFAFVLFFHENERQIAFIDNYMKIPKKSLVEEGTLNEQHKTPAEPSKYHKTDPLTQAIIEEQLSEAMLLLYGQMLGLAN